MLTESFIWSLWAKGKSDETFYHCVSVGRQKSFQIKSWTFKIMSHPASSRAEWLRALSLSNGVWSDPLWSPWPESSMLRILYCEWEWEHFRFILQITFTFYIFKHACAPTIVFSCISAECKFIIETKVVNKVDLHEYALPFKSLSMILCERN